MPTRGEPFDSRYPSGSLVHDGIWYLGSHPEGATNQDKVRWFDEPYPWAWTAPLTGFRISRDYGKTWSAQPNDPTKPLFEEMGMDDMQLDEEGRPLYGPIQIGEPFFVDFGKNMQHSPDGKAYLVGHGASQRAENPKQVNSSWCIGDQAFLIRVTPSPETINDASAYEFFAGHDDEGEPLWTKQRSEMKPLVEWTGRIGASAITYNPGLERYSAHDHRRSQRARQVPHLHPRVGDVDRAVQADGVHGGLRRAGLLREHPLALHQRGRAHGLAAVLRELQRQPGRVEGEPAREPLWVLPAGGALQGAGVARQLGAAHQPVCLLHPAQRFMSEYLAASSAASGQHQRVSVEVVRLPIRVDQRTLALLAALNSLVPRTSLSVCGTRRSAS